MEPLNHVELIAAFIQGQRIIGRTVEGHGYPQVDVEVLDVTADLVTVRSSWGGVMHIGPNASWISYYAYDVRKLEPAQTSDCAKERTGQWRSVKPPAPHADPRLWILNSSFTFPKPKPNPKPSRFPQVTHVGGLSWLTYRIIAGNWLAAICRRFFGAGAIDVECSIQNFSVKNQFVMFELKTQHGDIVPIRLSPETANRLAAQIIDRDLTQ